MSWKVDEAESWEGRAVFSEEVAAMLLYLPSDGLRQGAQEAGMWKE